jgi:hypothetical protein
LRIGIAATGFANPEKAYCTEYVCVADEVLSAASVAFTVNCLLPTDVVSTAEPLATGPLHERTPERASLHA